MIKELEALTKAIEKQINAKPLTTDEYAPARNNLDWIIQALESFDFDSWPDKLYLKWGTLKGYDLEWNKEALKLVQEYYELWANRSVMLQEDSKEQQEILLKLIDKIDWYIENDWSWEYYTKAQAKEYILNYKNHQYE